MTTINRYNQFPEYFGDNGIDLDDDTFNLALMNATHTFTATDNDWTDVSANDIGTGNGYTAAGQALTSVTWVESGGTVTFDAADVTWTASGGDIGPATDAVLYDDTSTVPVADLLAFSIDFEGSETAGNGTDFKVTWNGSGIFTVS